MEYRQTYDDPVEMLRTAMDARAADTWTALPGTIVSFDATKQTAEVRPAMVAVAVGPDRVETEMPLPVIPDVPVYFPAGGGYTLTFPVKKGDECWLVFSSRCIDQWWQSGEPHRPKDARMHDLSDPAAFVGVRSRPRALSGVSTTSTQLRSDDGALSVDVNSATGAITLKAPTLITLDAPETVITGSLSVANEGGAAKTATFTGTIKATVDVIGNNVSLKNHQHTGVQGGGGTSGTPTGGYS